MHRVWSLESCRAAVLRVNGPDGAADGVRWARLADWFVAAEGGGEMAQVPVGAGSGDGAGDGQLRLGMSAVSAEAMGS